MSTLGGSMAAHAAIWYWYLPLCVYIVFLRKQKKLFILLYIFFKSGIETPDRDGQWYQYLLTLWSILYKNNAKGTNFWILV